LFKYTGRSRLQITQQITAKGKEKIVWQHR